MLDFEYPEDRKFFADKLNNGDEVSFDSRFGSLFDFRDPNTKRLEFNSIRFQVLERLIQRCNKECQLELHEKCSRGTIWHVDHIIPLSTNELNKKLRNMKGVNGKKVLAQSFGSNSVENLTLACSRCNAYKKHRLILTKFPILQVENF